MTVVPRQVDAGPDADLEHVLVRLDVHALDGLKATGMERRTEEEVVDLGQLVVDRFDEVILNGGSREGASCGIAGHHVVFLLDFPLE